MDVAEYFDGLSGFDREYVNVATATGGAAVVDRVPGVECFSVELASRVLAAVGVPGRLLYRGIFRSAVS